MKKGGKTELILTVLAGSAFLTAELLDEFFNYPKSYKRAKRALFGSHISESLRLGAERQRFYSLLNELKRQGLVIRKTRDRGSLWNITLAGLNKLKLIRERKVDYQSVSDNKFKIIIFDVPEKLRRKRTWLREALGVLGFRMLQKSVWIGKNKIPEDFLSDLRNNGLMHFVHILEVTKTGSVKEMA